jgi:arylformamidase
VNILDISPLISPRIAVWPGDVPFSRSITCAIAAGANIDLSSLTSTVHLGAHTDAPSHYAAAGTDIASRDLSLYLGPCEVVHVDVARGERVFPHHFPGPPRAPRVLVGTGTFPDPESWNPDFASLSPELVAYLHDHGVILVGIDTPSIDPMTSKALESHQAVAARDMAILEGVVLTGAPAGLYTLVALPLRLEGADASPVRAVLLSGDP